MLRIFLPSRKGRLITVSISAMILLSIFSFLFGEFYFTSLPVQPGSINPGFWRYPRIKMGTTTPDEGHQHDASVNGTEEAFTGRSSQITKTKYPLTLTAPYIIENNDVCSGNVTVLTIVHTSTDHFHKRQRLRQSYGNVRLFITTYQMRIVFLIGTTNETAVQRRIVAENNKYRDIVQGDFIDSYRNLTLKGVMAYRWISDHCFHAKLVLKIDDDVYVNVFKIMKDILPIYGVKRRQILCNVMHRSPILRGKGKWQVDSDLFRGVEYYPPYCSGFTVLLTTDTARVMYQAANLSPFFWVDDVYLFGLLPAKGNIHHVTLNANLSLNAKRCRDDYVSESPKLLSCSAPKDNDFYFYWGRTLSTLSVAFKNTIDKSILDKYAKPK